MVGDGLVHRVWRCGYGTANTLGSRGEGIRGEEGGERRAVTPSSFLIPSPLLTRMFSYPSHSGVLPTHDPQFGLTCSDCHSLKTPEPALGRSCSSLC